MLRRWYVVLVCLSLAGALGYHLKQNGGTYTTATVVSFLIEPDTSLTPYNGVGNSNVISFATLVAQQVNNGFAPRGYAKDDAPLYGAGLRKGVLVAVPNVGGQWSTSYASAQIVIQVIGPSHSWVQQTQQQLLDQVLQASDEEQADAGVSPSQRFSASVVPATTEIDFVGTSKTALLGAVAALLVASLIVSAWLAVTTDRLLTSAVRRRRRQIVASPQLTRGAPA